jgi:hypothetical protein
VRRPSTLPRVLVIAHSFPPELNPLSHAASPPPTSPATANRDHRRVLPAPNDATSCNCDENDFSIFTWPRPLARPLDACVTRRLFIPRAPALRAARLASFPASKRQPTPCPRHRGIPSWGIYVEGRARRSRSRTMPIEAPWPRGVQRLPGLAPVLAGKSRQVWGVSWCGGLTRQ